MRIYTPFSHVGHLYYDPWGNPRCGLLDEVVEWFGGKDKVVYNRMDNPEWWFFVFEFDDLERAMLFKLTWA